MTRRTLVCGCAYCQVIEKLRLKNSTVKAQITKLEQQLAHKEEMGEVRTVTHRHARARINTHTHTHTHARAHEHQHTSTEKRTHKARMHKHVYTH